MEKNEWKRKKVGEDEGGRKLEKGEVEVREEKV